MVDRKLIDLPPNERPLDYKDFSYRPDDTQDQLFSGIKATFTITLGRRIPQSFIGPNLPIMNGDKANNEARSFAGAANEAWAQYRQSDIYREYVSSKLREKWEELKGEELTGIKLEFI